MMNNNSQPPMGKLDLIYRIFRLIFSKLSKLVDRIIYSKTAAALVSLVAAIIICVSINYDVIGTKLFDDKSTTVQINNVAVDTLYDSQKYDLSGVPSTVTVMLTGKATDIQVFRAKGEVKVVCDLRKNQEGDSSIALQVNNLPSNLNAKIEPSSVTAHLAERVSKRFSVLADIQPSSSMKQTDWDATLDTNSVTVTGTQEQVDSIRTVKAIIDATDQKNSFETSATLQAYDSKGATVDVQIDPGTVKAQVKLKNNQ